MLDDQARRDRAEAAAHLRLAHAGLEYRQVLLWFSRPHPSLDGRLPSEVSELAQFQLLDTAARDTARLLKHRFQPSTPDVDDECFVCDLLWQDGQHDDTVPTSDDDT